MRVVGALADRVLREHDEAVVTIPASFGGNNVPLIVHPNWVMSGIADK
jgi:hypothetical protein